MSCFIVYNTVIGTVALRPEVHTVNLSFQRTLYRRTGNRDRSPAVKEDFRRWADVQRGAYVVLESAILFESGFDTQVDTTLAVMAPMEERLRRTVERDGVDREAVRRRMEHQLSDDELHARAARTIVNLRMDYLESDVEQLHKIYCYEASL